MAMTAAEKQRVINALNRMDNASRQRILSTWASFRHWLWQAFRWIFEKLVESAIDRLWRWLTGR